MIILTLAKLTMTEKQKKTKSKTSRNYLILGGFANFHSRIYDMVMLNQHKNSTLNQLLLLNTNAKFFAKIKWIESFPFRPNPDD